MGEHRETFLMLAPVLATLVNVAVHVMLMRTRILGAHLGPVIVAFLVGLTAVLTITGRLAGHQGLGWTELLAIGSVNTASYCGLGYCYFTVVNLVFTSLRIRMVRELLESPDHSLPAARLKAVYNLGTILNKRLERLVAWGQVYSSGNRYYLRGMPAFLILDRQILRIRHLLTGSAVADDRRNGIGAPQ